MKFHESLVAYNVHYHLFGILQEEVHFYCHFDNKVSKLSMFVKCILNITIYTMLSLLQEILAGESTPKSQLLEKEIAATCHCCTYIIIIHAVNH
jgi:hypothetical protein